MNIKGKDYLQVAHRLVWFREERKEWSIETEVNRQKDETFAKAIIRNESGRIMAIAHKFEDKAGFSDHAEKAETGAVGRALALCGFGTQFSPDLDEGSRLADSPVGSSYGIHPENPEPGDGIYKDDGYRVPFGQYNKRKLEEIQLDDLKSYIVYIEGKAEKTNKPITGEVKDFVDRAYAYIAAMESDQVETFSPNFDRDR